VGEGLMIRKVVVTAAGLGTRLLPMSKELPKEMLPIFVRGKSGLVLKPLLQALFEQLYEFGFREFCFVVGRGKRAIEDHFTPDWDYIAKLNNKGKENFASEMLAFYKMVESSTIVWVNQPEPRGFGHAVLMARPFIANEPFMVCAGDTYIISSSSKFIRRMIDIFLESKVDAVILLQEVSDPKDYGVAVAEKLGSYMYRILRVVEKPKVPPSNLAIMPFYIFNPVIMDVIEGLKPGVGGEIQLTDAIQRLIDEKRDVRGILLDRDELRLDIGTPKTYWEAVRISHEYWSRSD